MADDGRQRRSRAAILDAALAAFAEHGYEGTTVERIAEAAGVVKRTVYNLYPDKEQLFRATVERALEVADRFGGDLGAMDPDAALTALPGIAERLAAIVLSPEVLPERRLLVRESARFPDLADRYHRGAPQATLDALATALRRIAEAGLLRIEDPRLAAEHLAFLAMGADLDRAMFGAAPPAGAALRRRARAGADAFLRAYSAGGVAAAPHPPAARHKRRTIGN